MRVHFRTFGCKTNQYDTERMRQSIEATYPDARTARLEEAELCVVNTCTVTSQADADARRFIRRAARRSPGVRVVVAGCSAVLRARDYRAMEEVGAVVEGHDPDVVLAASRRLLARNGLSDRNRTDAGDGSSPLLSLRRATPLRRRAGATRGWLKVQDGCDRKCSFCATRLARGASRSRPPREIVAEARILARTHPELVITGVHIGHYGRDLNPRGSLTELVRRLLDEVPAPRFRLGSIEATEVDDELIRLLADARGRLAPHLHMPLQSGADPVLRRMRRWHTREQYRQRALEIAAAAAPIGLGADIITGFPGETEADHRVTMELVEELPFTYLHVFPWSPRTGTVAATLSGRLPERISWERARALRSLGTAKGERYARSRGGSRVEVVMEGDKGTALTGDYLRVRVGSRPPDEARSPEPGQSLREVRPPRDARRIHSGRLSSDGRRVKLAAAVPGDATATAPPSFISPSFIPPPADTARANRRAMASGAQPLVEATA